LWSSGVFSALREALMKQQRESGDTPRGVVMKAMPVASLRLL